MLPVTFGSLARSEMLGAIDWYNAHRPTVGERFLAEVDAVVSRIAENPRQFPVIYKDVRRARLRRFPYALFFCVNEDSVEIIACFQSNRNPKRWRERR